VNKGLVAAQWQEFADHCLKGSSPDGALAAKTVFYAGATAMMQLLLEQVMDSTDDPVNFVDMAKGIEEELHVFARSIVVQGGVQVTPEFPRPTPGFNPAAAWPFPERPQAPAPNESPGKRSPTPDGPL
jgi:hypothetical protein